jgi:leucyl-tRNA synthetase/REP element-mobilizing transposase RayT
MSDHRKPFPFSEFEPKWQARWEAEKTFRTPGPGEPGFDPAKPKFYVLDMFPYPSGSGLHVGHPEGYTATDIIGRYKRMTGHNVLHPMGYDSFGLPAEQYAIKTGQHPAITTAANIENFRRQLKSLGFAYDWDREIATTDPEYVRWTQWIFLQLYHSYFCEETNRARPVAELEAKGWTRTQIAEVRLAYVANTPVWWSPDLGTVLANEEVEEWKGKGHTVERRPLRQWMLRITKYAQRLIDELDTLDWPEGIKLLQKNWIGRSEGASVKFQIADFKSQIEVFTTRPDTLFGATYMVLAPEHPFVPEITTAEHREAVEAYQKACAAKSDMDRGDLNKDKSGVFTGAHAVNPVNGEQIPIWIADYVMMGYGTGAIMAVPAHDERDFEFATKFGLPIVEVVSREPGGTPDSRGVGILPSSGGVGVSPSSGGVGVSPSSGRVGILPSSGGVGVSPSSGGVGVSPSSGGVGVSPSSGRVGILPSSRPVGVSPTESPYLNPTCPIHKHRPHQLPHWQQDAKLYFVTWRLADSLPAEKLESWRQERATWLAKHPEPWSPATEEEYHEKFSKTIDHWLDAGGGECLLKDPVLAKIVADALLHFDGERCLMDSFVVMPNHVHALFRLAPDVKLQELLHSWKSFTAKRINEVLGRSGGLWQGDYWDRIVRDAGHLANLREYIGKNPVRARLGEGNYIYYSVTRGETPRILEEGRMPTPLEDRTPSPLEAFCDPGISINSGFITGLPTAEAKAQMIDWLEANHLGQRRIQYKLRDWLFSRQRYWGEPFPIVWKDGQHVAIDDAELPLLAPPLADYKPSGTPDPLLSKATEWVNLPDGSTRETNTMPQWAGSCWYYLRYCDPRNADRFISHEAEAYWTSEKPGMVDLYVGGTEHAVLHLLYARFWHKVLFDLGHVTTPEPFQRLVNQGLILGEDGQKMSKSRGNVVNPDDVVREYGADSLRLYEMFMGPLEQVKPWQMKGVEGVSRFLARVWRVAFEQGQDGSWQLSSKLRDVPCTDRELLRVVHETIRKTGEDIEKLSFNTAISQMMICTNAFTQVEIVPVAEFIQFLTVLNPFAPHLAEEIHERVAAAFNRPVQLLSEMPWPAYDPAALVRNEIELVVQVNGKLRDRLMIAKDADEQTATTLALASPRIKEHTEGKTVRKIIFIPGKLLNLVAN